MPMSSEGGIRTLDTAGMNRVLWPTELLRRMAEAIASAFLEITFRVGPIGLEPMTLCL